MAPSIWSVAARSSSSGNRWNSQITLAAASHAIVGSELTMLIYPIVVTLLTLASWALRPSDRVLRATSA